MLTSDLTRKLKGAHNIPIPTPLITAFLPFLWKGPPLFPLPVFLHPPSLFAPATKVTFLFNRECKSRNIQIPSWSSPLPSSHPGSAGVDPKLIQFYNTTWRSAVKYIFSASELRCKPGIDRNPFYILSGTGWWIGSVYSTDFVEERYFETCKILITCLI